MKDAKLVKSLRILLHLSVIIVIILSQMNCTNENGVESITSLKSKGFIDLDMDNIVSKIEDSISIQLNAKKLVDNFECEEFNASPSISYITTTLLPNNDGGLYQANWQAPEEIKNSINYFYIETLFEKDSFFLPAISDFSSMSNGHPVLFIYIDESDYFSDSTGIYVPGIRSDTNNIKKGGNYAMHGKEWERKVYYQFFSPEGEVKDQGWAGSRIHGNLSRAAPQKSLRLYSREEYGKDHFISPFNDSIPLSRFILRTPFASNRELIYKDAMISEIALNMGMDAMRSTPVSVYLNGEYWGYFNYRDRIDDHYFSMIHKVDTLDLVDMWARAKYGSPEEYKKVFKWLIKNDLRISENYDSLLTTIDIENYTKYLLIELFFANKDWPHNNVKFWRSTQLDNKWRWVIYDLDASASFRPDMAEFIEKHNEKRKNSWSTSMMISMLANDQFYERLINEYLKLKEAEFNVDFLKHKADSLYNLYEPLMPAQIDRWHFPSSLEHFEKVHDDFFNFLEYRDSIFVDEMARLHNYAIKYQDEKFGVLSR